jgi:hypothetical protein
MKNLILIITVCLTLLNVSIFAQSIKCATMKHLQKRIKEDPTLFTRMQQSEIRTHNWISEQANFKKTQQVISIPVVVHVLWHDPIENISDQQIQSQIDVLNEDFRLMNADSLDYNHPFWVYSSDTEIEFCLASRDPDGNATDGITRTFTDSVSFVGEGNEKASATGGVDNWDPTEYLNIWVCNLDGSGGTLGYASFPSDLATNPDEDGVVIRYEAFGSEGTAGSGSFTENDGGRTGTHEVGHWLNLRHIWGDDTCGDDFVADTKTAEEANYGCPSFPHKANNACGTDADGEMYMNYMDYVDDACMNMFTEGQTDRMHAALNGDRIGLLTSSGCGSPNALNEYSFDNSIKILPNPNNGNFTINFIKVNTEIINISVYDLVGSQIKKFENVKVFPFKMEMNELSNGVYHLIINSADKTKTQKIIIAK